MRLNDSTIRAYHFFVGRKDDNLTADVGEEQGRNLFAMFCIDTGKGSIDDEGNCLVGGLDDCPIQGENKNLFFAFG